jgi:hypothetical protein
MAGRPGARWGRGGVQTGKSMKTEHVENTSAASIVRGNVDGAQDACG